MCILHVTNFYCNCPMRDGRYCPHNNYIRDTLNTPILPTTPEPTGYYLRRARDYQCCVRWEPMATNQVWEHCSTFIRDRLTDPVRCPETIAAGDGHIYTRQRRDRCDQCRDGHPLSAMPPAERERRRLFGDTYVIRITLVERHYPGLDDSE